MGLDIARSFRFGAFIPDSNHFPGNAAILLEGGDLYAASLGQDNRSHLPQCDCEGWNTVSKLTGFLAREIQHQRKLPRDAAEDQINPGIQPICVTPSETKLNNTKHRST